jgi:Ser/Thr protein kinase RdoA (MazF antagonist)
MQIRVVEPFDGHHPGEIVEKVERQALELVAKGLAKMHQPAQNKMAPQAENKANPTAAAGKARTSSASPAARVSRQPIAKPSADGARPKRTTTRRAKS